MSWKRRIHGGLLAFVGFMLSPLSWWNDAFVNVPLAYGFASLISLVYRPAFEMSWIVGYWLTNVLGFVLMQKGAMNLAAAAKPYTRRDFLRDLLVSLAYTMLIALLIRLRLLKPFPAYFSDG